MLNRATEVFLTQLMPVSEMALRQGLWAFGASRPTQVVVWGQLMDAKTVQLTANADSAGRDADPANRVCAGLRVAPMT